MIYKGKIFDLQGHRGCRGIMPENTIPAFEKAFKLKVDTLEMDLVISKDKKIVVSHEPWFSSEYCLDKNCLPIPPESEREHNIYEMSYPEVTLYDCGTKGHPRFPLQNKLQVSKPTFRKVVERMEECRSVALNNFIRYNIEIKSTPEGDGIFHPNPEEFADLIIEEIAALGVSQRTTIQSFDIRPLQYIRDKGLDISLSLLVENNDSLESNIERLGFVPQYYSPEYTLVDEELMKAAGALDIKVLPWTVNDLVNVEKLLDLGVSGIITDFPDMFKDLDC